ncbi:MAG: phenylalanine--tRNA ligase subunit beta, partial [Smithellaceae bacterium]|nr:phenylalanine--tRNA ligase subunit beta [Smithellaceae bacterium]
MLISLKWLNDYVDIEMSADELAHTLTMAGLEVESISEKKPAFSQVVIGKIITIGHHPEADHLSVCVISTGEGKAKVVCGAGNIYEGALVPLATVGAMVGSARIERSLIRGVESDGMLCSEAELGIGEDHSGILILEDGLTPGVPLEKALDLEDTILEISVTPNRSDCLSMIGIAREVAALTGKTLRYSATNLKEEGPDINLFASVAIDDPELCPRYAARLIRGVKVGPSPYWLRKRLAAVGLRPINNVVDVTNYVMMELGQPLHAFDHNQLSGGRIVVRGAKDGELFLTLDGKERVLKQGTLMICDADKPVAIAGIMGGMNSEVQDATDSILLESAYFSPLSIRRSAKWLAMTSDASFRFERGIDPEGVTIALDRAAQLIAELAGGSICLNLIDRYPREIAKTVNILMRESRVNQLLGTQMSGDEMAAILNSLEMKVTPQTGREGCYLVTPPSYRVDITRETDLIEEIARIYGYDKIGTTLPNVFSLTVKGSMQSLVT